MGSGLSMGDIHQLSEQHQFVLLLLAQAASIVSMVLLYRSSPRKKLGDGSTDPAKPPSNG